LFPVPCSLVPRVCALDIGRSLDRQDPPPPCNTAKDAILAIGDAIYGCGIPDMENDPNLDDWGKCTKTYTAPCDKNEEAVACTEYAGKEVEKMAAKEVEEGREVTENAVKMQVLALVGECLYEKAFGSAIDPDNAKAAYDSVMEAIATCGDPDEALAADQEEFTEFVAWGACSDEITDPFKDTAEVQFCKIALEKAMANDLERFTKVMDVTNELTGCLSDLAGTG